MPWPKKNSSKEFDNEKKFLRFENSPPPLHNFSNGPSLKSRKYTYLKYLPKDITLATLARVCSRESEAHGTKTRT